MKLRLATAFALCAAFAVAGDPPAPAPTPDPEMARIEYLQGFTPPFESPTMASEFVSNVRMLRAFYSSPRAHVGGQLDEARGEYLNALVFDEYKGFVGRAEKEAVMHRFALESRSPIREDLAAMGYSTSKQVQAVRHIAGLQDENFDLALAAMGFDAGTLAEDPKSFDAVLGTIQMAQFLVEQRHLDRKTGNEKAEGDQAYPPITELWPIVKECAQRYAADARTAGFAEDQISKLEQMLAMTPGTGAAIPQDPTTKAKTTPQSTSSEEETPNVHPSR